MKRLVLAFAFAFFLAPLAAFADKPIFERIAPPKDQTDHWWGELIFQSTSVEGTANAKKLDKKKDPVAELSIIHVQARGGAGLILFSAKVGQRNPKTKKIESILAGAGLMKSDLDFLLKNGKIEVEGRRDEKVIGSFDAKKRVMQLHSWSSIQYPEPAPVHYLTIQFDEKLTKVTSLKIISGPEKRGGKEIETVETTAEASGEFKQSEKIGYMK